MRYSDWKKQDPWRYELRFAEVKLQHGKVEPIDFEDFEDLYAYDYYEAFVLWLYHTDINLNKISQIPSLFFLFEIYNQDPLTKTMQKHIDISKFQINAFLKWLNQQISRGQSREGIGRLSGFGGYLDEFKQIIISIFNIQEG